MRETGDRRVEAVDFIDAGEGRIVVQQFRAATRSAGATALPADLQFAGESSPREPLQWSLPDNCRTLSSFLNFVRSSTAPG